MKRSKQKLLAMIAGGILLCATVLANAKMIGKSYKSSRDYSCCVGSSLYIFHYYTYSIMWINVSSGYEQEFIGSGSCQYQCGAPA